MKEEEEEEKESEERLEEGKEDKWRGSTPEKM